MKPKDSRAFFRTVKGGFLACEKCKRPEDFKIEAPAICRCFFCGYKKK